MVAGRDLRVRHATGVLGLRGVNWSVANWRVAGGSETAHGGSSCGVGWGLLETCAWDIVLHGHHLWAVAGGCVVAGRDHGGRGNRDIRVGHGHGGGAADLLTLDGVERETGPIAHGGGIYGGSRVRSGMRGGPRVCELWWIVVVDIIEAHAAIGAVLVFNDHRHGEYGREMSREPCVGEKELFFLVRARGEFVSRTLGNDREVATG